MIVWTDGDYLLFRCKMPSLDELLNYVPVHRPSLTLGTSAGGGKFT
jgi:hypothetical protein